MAVSVKMGCTDKDMEVCTEESVVILLKQCRDMRRQETLFRVATLLLLCFCTTLTLLSSFGFGRFTQQEKMNSSMQEKMNSSMQERMNSSMQERIPDSGESCSSSTNGKMHIHLIHQLNTPRLPPYIPYEPAFNSCLTFENSSVMIPLTGVYFVYARFTLRCQDSSLDFSMTVERWSESYPDTTKLMTATSRLNCMTDDFQTVYVGELLDLGEGDQLKVNVSEGYDLINESNFGAFSQ
ncbi:Tumor necrosis factor ligand superfamily member 15 [Oryzias melastigma]|uniref:Tumor necrosis factor ligand superfamily member 15 n=1 Tax=Oryzias melastigma TaxID=30732 RepID=A0A834F7Q5_ORYME|nr:Tumor necrosis factor ligand superfamily member 15 [Oryzias melastigma]